MKIAKIEVQLVDSGHGDRLWVHVRVTADDGSFGIGEATYSGKETTVASMVRALAPLVTGSDPFCTESIWRTLAIHPRGGYDTGGIIFASAISGIDQALWDLKGKLLQAPVAALLGGPRSAWVPVYAHFGGSTADELLADADRRLAEGFTAIKSAITVSNAPGPRVSRSELAAIDARYSALRSHLPDDIELMDDPHGVYSPGSALEIARLLEPYRLLFLEEPTSPEDPESYAAVRAGSRTPVAGSEHLTNKHRFRRFFDVRAVDVAQPDVVYVGGITELKKIAALAEIYQVSVAPHSTKGPVGTMAAAHVMASIPNALIQEFITPAWIPWRDSVLAEPLELHSGKLRVPDRPGLGIEFDEEALRPHIVADWA